MPIFYEIINKSFAFWDNWEIHFRGIFLGMLPVINVVPSPFSATNFLFPNWSHNGEEHGKLWAKIANVDEGIFVAMLHLTSC